MLLDWLAFCKTTGGKGLHVVTPLVVEQEEQNDMACRRKSFAHDVCLQMWRDTPTDIWSIWPRSSADGRIFLDSHLRNDRMATAVAPLSSSSPSEAPQCRVPLTWAQSEGRSRSQPLHRQNSAASS